MEKLKTLISEHDEVRGVVQAATGEIREFHRPGVADFFAMLTTEPAFLRDAVIADRIIGRGAAFLLVKGGVREVFAFVMSEPAREVLQKAGIKVSCDRLEPKIVNRDGTGTCPVEMAVMDTESPDEAFLRIEAFLRRMQAENKSKTNN